MILIKCCSIPSKFRAREETVKGSEELTRSRSGGKKEEGLRDGAQKRRAEYPVSYNLQRLSVRPGTECIPGTETETESAS